MIRARVSVEVFDARHPFDPGISEVMEVKRERPADLPMAAGAEATKAVVRLMKRSEQARKVAR